MSEIKKLPSLDSIKGLPSSEAIPILDAIIKEHPLYEEAITLRGLKYWALNRPQQAIENYLRALQINPDSKAATALQYAKQVLDFYNPDLLNP